MTLTSFVIIAVGLAAAWVLSYRFARNDIVARFLWMLAGAAPGVSLHVERPVYMVAVLVPCAVVLWKRSHTSASLRS